ncbi:hypothetical protein EQG63_05745 [Flavobacterium amnicola]|uniref:DUF2946 domain-containing protein n=1 Tax=Flavobacterium amnicola TaxID=2506422 RepID=A0A4Q1K2K2_9FLAO|nr:hypothetical protein [Flavobacterium amnicola]RXR18947.1 hypothetical protein EQG63_05745 [Flavobacterium amnicola]
MNKKINIFSFSLLGALLFAITFQSVHSFEHLVKQLSTEHCAHQYDHSHTVISHAHTDFDHCFSCEYSFNNFTFTDFISFEIPISIEYNTISLFGYGEKLIFFSGSALNSRGPPSITA